MAYEFKTLGSVEALTEVPENANALVEVDGAIKRVPGGALGGSSGNSNERIFILHKEYNEQDYWFDEGVSLQLFETMKQNIYPQIVIIETNDSDAHRFMPILATQLLDYSTSGSGVFLTLLTPSQEPLEFTFYNDNFNFNSNVPS